MASQAPEHVITAVATSEDIHIERKDAHQLDTITRRIPADNLDRDALTSVTFLEVYATSYRYGTPTGRVPTSPPIDRIAITLDRIDVLIAVLRQHFVIAPGEGGTAMNTAPRRP